MKHLTPDIDTVANDTIDIWSRIILRDRAIEEAKRSDSAETTTVSQSVTEYRRVVTPTTDTVSLVNLDSISSEYRASLYRETIFPTTGPTPADSILDNIYSEGELSKTVSEGSHRFALYSSKTTGDLSGKDYNLSSWLLAGFILSFLILTLLKSVYMKHISPLLISVFSYKRSEAMYIERSVSAQNAYILLSLVSGINISLYLIIVAAYFNLELPEMNLGVILFLITLIVLMLFGIKTLALSVTGFIFERVQLFSEYNHNRNLFNIVSGIVIIPLLILLAFGSFDMDAFLIKGILLIWTFLYIFQLVRGVQIILRKEFSIFYLILYFCALEILPIIVLFKLLKVLIL